MKIKSIFIVFTISVLSYLVFFYPMLNKNTIIYSIYSEKDTIAFHLQSRIYLYEKLQEGKYPFWTERMFGGYPIYADLERGFLNPLNVALIYLFGPFTSYKILHFVFYLLGSYSLYLLLKRYKVNFLGYSAANLIYFFSFFGIYHQQHFNMILSVYLFPLILYLIQKYIEEKKLRYIFLNSLVLANCFYLGSFQIILISLLTSFIYLIIFNRLEKNTTHLKENLIYLFFFLVSFLILISPGLYANLDLYKYSFQTDEFVFTPTYSYVGISSLILSILGYISLKKGENAKNISKKESKNICSLKIFLISLVWFFLLFAFIKNIPVLRDTNLFLFSLLKHWVKSSFLISFVVSVLSAIFLSNLTKLKNITIKDFKFLLPVIFYLLILEILNIKQLGIGNTFKLLPKNDYTLDFYFILCGIVLVLSLLCIYLRKTKYINYVLIGIVCLDIIFFGKVAFNNSFINTNLLNTKKLTDLKNTRLLNSSREITRDIFVPGEYEISNIIKKEGYINAYISAINQTNIDTTLRYYPGWILKKTDMYRNEITQRESFISFNMDPGSADVKLIYTPISLYLGARLSAILFIISSWLYYFLKRNVLKDVKF